MYTPPRRLLAATAALASALFLAGCASDDDPIATPSEPVETASATPSAAPTIDDLCDAKVAIDAAFLAGGPPEEDGDATPSPEEVGQGISAAFSDLYADMKEAAAGSQVESDVDTLVSGLEAAVEEGDDEFFFKPDFVAADKVVDDFLVDECDFNEIAGTAADFEFTGLPTVSPAGLTALTLTNDGEEFHEMVLMRIADDVDEDIEELLAMDEDELGDKVIPMGVVLASPGTTATNFFDLSAGRYAVLCFISEGSDQEHDFQGDGPPHFTKGMVEELRVLADATSEPTSATSSDDEESAEDGSSSSSASTSEDEEDSSSSGSPSAAEDDDEASPSE